MAALSAMAEDVPDEELDAEWEDFQRLLTEYKLRHKQSPMLDLDWSAKPKAKVQASFYPCPAPVEEEKELDIDVIKSVRLRTSCRMACYFQLIWIFCCFSIDACCKADVKK